MIVGTLGKALGSYGAYVCASRELVDLLVNTARPVHLLDRAAAAVGRRGARRPSALLESRPGMVEQLRRNAAILREALGRERAGDRRLAHPDRPDHGRRRPPRDARSASARSRAACSPRRSARRPCPTGTSRLRLTVMASHRADDLRAAAGVIGRAAAKLGVASRSGPTTPAARGLAAAALRCARGLDTPGVFVTGTGTEVGKTVVAAAIARTRRPRDAAVAGVQARGQRPRRPRRRRGRPRAAAAGRRRSRRPTTRSPPTATARPSRPTSAPSSPGEPIDPESLRRRPRRPPPRRAELLVAEGVGGFLVPLTTEYLVRDLARRSRAAGRDRRLARPRDDQPHAADARVRARRRPRGRRWSCSPRGPMSRASRSARTAETIARLGGVEVATLPWLELDRVDDWPRLHAPGLRLIRGAFPAARRL